MRLSVVWRAVAESWEAHEGLRAWDPPGHGLASVGFSAVAAHDPEAEHKKKMCPCLMQFSHGFAVSQMYLLQPDGTSCKSPWAHMDPQAWTLLL